MTSKKLEREAYGSHVEEIDEKTLILTNQLHCLITYTWDVLNVNANRMKLLLKNIQRCLNYIFLLEQLKKYQGVKNFTRRQLRGPTTWKGMLKSALKDIVSWQTKRQSSCTRSQLVAWMTIISKKKNLESVQYGKNLTQDCSVVLRHGRTCSKMR